MKCLLQSRLWRKSMLLISVRNCLLCHWINLNILVVKSKLWVTVATDTILTHIILWYWYTYDKKCLDLHFNLFTYWGFCLTRFWTHLWEIIPSITTVTVNYPDLEIIQHSANPKETLLTIIQWCHKWVLVVTRKHSYITSLIWLTQTRERVW